MNERLGDKLGPRIAQIVSDAIVATKRQMADHDSSVIATGIEKLIDLMGQEMQPHVAKVLSDIADHPDVTGDAESLLRFTAHHRGEAASGIRFLLGATGLTQGIGTVINAAMAPGIQQALALMRNALHDTGTAASLVATRIIDAATGEDEARRQNLDGNRFDNMIQLAYQVPGIPELFAMNDRGALTDAELQHWLERSGLHPDLVGPINILNPQLLTPEQAADMQVRGIITQDEGRAIAAKSSLAADDYDRLVLDTGEPLAIEQLLLLYRRGELTEAEVEHGIRQSRIRNEWIPSAINLRYAPPSASDAIRAAVQNQLPHDEAIKKFQEAGLNPTDFDWLFNTAGRPPGVQELITLARRGKVTIDVIKQAVRESDIKSKYVDTIAELYEYRPPPRTIVALLRAGTISDTEGLQLLIQEGLDPKLAEAYLHEAHKTRTQSARNLAQGEIVKLYHERAIDEAKAQSMLEGIGWAKADAEFILLAEDLRREAQYLEAALHHVHTLYVGYKTSRAVAVSSLGELGIPQSQAAHLLELWDFERGVNVPSLTRSQIASAYKWSLITLDDALAKLMGLGWSQDDAVILLELATHHPLGETGA